MWSLNIYLLNYLSAYFYSNISATGHIGAGTLWWFSYKLVTSKARIGLFSSSLRRYTHVDTHRAKTGCACLQPAGIRYLQTACIHAYRHECVCIPACMYVAYFSTFYYFLMNTAYWAHGRDIYIHSCTSICVSIKYHIHLIIVIVLYLDCMLSYLVLMGQIWLIVLYFWINL